MKTCAVLYVLLIIWQNLECHNSQKKNFLENDAICFDEKDSYKNTTTNILKNYLSKFEKTRKCETACNNYKNLKNQLDILIQNYIMGGSVCNDISENPHIVALGYFNKKTKNYKFSCGGSLVSPSFVLTAAHCIINPEKSKLKFIRIGVIFIPEFIETLNFSHDILVKKISVHPEYKRIPKLHDIAVVELEKNINLAYNFQPICLYTKNDNPENLEIAGWGTTQSGLRSDILQRGYVDSVPQQHCQHVYSKKYFLKIEATHVCAGNNSINTCKGDSGGPLQIQKNGISYLVGITAGGTKCGSKTPGIYTRVSSYLDWIEKIIWS